MAELSADRPKSVLFCSVVVCAIAITPHDMARSTNVQHQVVIDADKILNKFCEILLKPA